MKRIFTLVLLLLTIASHLIAQVAKERVVLIQVIKNDQKPALTLQWDFVSGVNDYTIYRKSPEAWNWTALKTQTGSDTLFTDSTIERGIAYDYYINRRTGTTNLYGFITAGIEVEAVHYRGEVFIALDSALNSSLSEKLMDYYALMVGDGWRVHPVVTKPHWTVPQLKDTIQAWHRLNPSRHNTLLLLGDIPVPYSGNLNPDAHPDHKGAWPADVYYGEFQGSWTDLGNFPGATRPENVNIPGDGKFDQTTIPGEVKLQIGRIYLDKLSTFGLTRDSLYTRYLQKASSYRINEWNLPRRAIIDDRLAALGGEYPGRNGYQNGNALFGNENTITNVGTYIDSLRNGPWLFSHASSTGGYTSNQQLNSDMFKTATYAVFQTSFGSYHGDWDINNNLLRAEIAGPGYGLTAVWAGRPQWHFLHMAMGFPIGFSARITQSNFVDANHQTYDPGFGAGYVHVTLMGDPTLRLHMINPPGKVNSVTNSAGDEVNLTWVESSDAEVMGYYIYRSDSLFGIWNRITSSAVTGNSYTDNKPLKGNNVYMVRALKLEEVPSGSYFNMSQGSFATAIATNGTGTIVALNTAEKSINVFPNPANNFLNIEIKNIEGAKVELYTLMGQLLFEKDAHEHMQIDIRSFLPGVYLVKIGDTVERVVITH